MSQRFGMADARCFTTYVPSVILNDIIANKVGINIQDGHQYRKFMQDNADELIKKFAEPSMDCIKVRDA